MWQRTTRPLYQDGIVKRFLTATRNKSSTVFMRIILRP